LVFLRLPVVGDFDEKVPALVDVAPVAHLIFDRISSYFVPKYII
jgi:hypothetical protein